MIFKEEFTPLNKINLLQKWIILQSTIYYKLNQNIVSDHDYDANSVQLVSLMKAYPEELKESKYYYVMADFDGSTGMDLFSRLNIEDEVEMWTLARYFVG